MRAWAGLTRVVMIQSERTIKSLTSTKRRYYLSSLEASAEVTLASIRSHWSVENSLHWVLDVVFNEDAHRARKDHVAANLGVLRQLALNLLKRVSSPRKNMSLKNKRNRAGWDDLFLERVLAEL